MSRLNASIGATILIWPRHDVAFCFGLDVKCRSELLSITLGGLSFF